MSRILVLLGLIAVLAQAVSAIFIDYCSANEFERLYDRSDLLSVDHRNPETHHDITRYKRDFADGTKYEKNTFITWRFPNGQRNDRLFIVVNEMRPQLLIPRQNNLSFSWSNDARNWNAVPASGISSTLEALNDEWNRRNVSIALPRLARFFRVNWPDCEWDTQTQRATCR